MKKLFPRFRTPFFRCIPVAACLVMSSQGLAADDGRDAETFRNIFHHYAKSQFSDADIQKLIFKPKPEFFITGDVTGDPSAALQQRARSFSSFKPLDLYADGRKTAFADSESPDKDLDAKPITIVIIPGIFGEFITHFPFHEVLADKTSAFAKEWAQAAIDHPTVDPVFDLETLTTAARPMEDIIEASSIDNSDGKAVIRVVYLKPLIGSLETLGTLEDSSSLYLRRLNKLWSMLGPQENVYLLGYSRGLNVALDLISRAEIKPDAYPWLKDLKGVVSLGGTLYGSDLADAARSPGQASFAFVERILTLADTLQVLPENASLGDKISAVSKNTAAWAGAMMDLLAIGAKRPPYDGLMLENIATDSPSPSAFAEIFKTFAFEKFKVTVGSEYSNNVAKFKYLVKETLEGIETLTKQSSLEWAKNHIIASHLKYFVIQGTMGDPSSRLFAKNELAQDSVSFNTHTLDYKALRLSYYDYMAFEGMAINDSQVSPDRSVFWPELHMALNPSQKPFEARLIAILGTDHWGMSFPVALESKNKEISPYPRALLLKSLGAFLAKDLNK